MTRNRLLLTVLLLIPGISSGQERSLSLNECLELSHNGNPAVMNAAIDVNMAKAQKQEAATNWFPTVSASAYGFNSIDPLVKIGLDDVLGSSDAANNLKYYAETMGGLTGINTEWSLLNHGYIAAINIAQPVFAGGRIVNGNALAAMGIKAAEVKSDIAVRDNDDSVVKKYWTVVSLSEKKKALQHGIDLVNSLAKDVEAAFKAGLAKESDLMQVRLKEKELETIMIKLRSGERLAKMDLFNFIGLEYKVLALDSIILSDSPDGLLSPEHYYQDEESVAADMDESRLLEMSVEAKRLEKKMAVGEGLPQIGIGASLGYGQIIGNARPNGAVYAMVKIPISEWGRTARKIQRSQYELEKAENDKAYLDKQLRLKVSKEWIDLQCAWEQKLASEDAVALSEMLEAQKREEYDAGLCTVSELLKCQSDLQAALSALADSRIEYCNAVSDWLKH